MDDRYVARFLNLTTLAPAIVAAILDETLPEEVTLADLSLNPVVVWDVSGGRWGWRGDNHSRCANLRLRITAVIQIDLIECLEFAT